MEVESMKWAPLISRIKKFERGAGFAFEVREPHHVLRARMALQEIARNWGVGISIFARGNSVFLILRGIRGQCFSCKRSGKDMQLVSRLLPTKDEKELEERKVLWCGQC